MPIYEYECQDCGHQFEQLVRGKEEIVCPECNSRSLKKLISRPNTPGSEGCEDGTCDSCPSCDS